MDSKILNTIKKCLALGARGGTEAEALAAMEKAHELLSKHGLSMADIKIEESAVEEDKTALGAKISPWKRWIWGSVSRLYYCHYIISFDRKTCCLVGKPENIACAKYLIEYVIKSGETLAAAAGKQRPAIERRSFNHSFKIAFGENISYRVTDMLKAVMEKGVKDAVTGTSLVVMPLYKQSAAENAAFIAEKIPNLQKMRKSRPTVTHKTGYDAGAQAGKNLALNTGIGKAGNNAALGG